MVGAGLLVAAGVSKLVAGGAGRVDGLPDLVPQGPLLGMVEVGIGAWALVAPGTVSLAVLGSTYALLAALTGWQHSMGVQDCGCFGSAPVRPSIFHTVMNAGFAVAAGLSVIAGWPELTAAAQAGAALLAVMAGFLISAVFSEAAEVSRLVAESESVRG